MPPRKSLVLVTVDCLSADHCGFMGYRRPTTPFLDGLASESFIFPTAIVAGVPTPYSFPAILASRYPLDLGREVLGLAVEETCLASVLKDDGYATAFFGAANPYLSAQFGYDFGFDTFYDFLDADLTPLCTSRNTSLEHDSWKSKLNRTLEMLGHKIPGLGAAYDELYFRYSQRLATRVPMSFDMLRRFPAADVIVDEAQTWLASVGENPFFLWLHFMDPHAPYYPTEQGLEMLGENPLTASQARYLNAYWNRPDIGTKRLRRHRDEIITLYDSGIRWVDTQLARLIETLRKSKLWENCIFAFTADHGEEFLEHGARFHDPSLVEELIHVPFLLRVPGAEKKTVCSNPFSFLHLAPTLLAAAGSPIPSEFQGQSHWTHIRDGREWGDPAIAECAAGPRSRFRPDHPGATRLLAVRESRYKLVLNFDVHTDNLFDLAADPGEQNPLPNAAKKPERRRLLESALAHLKRSASQRSSQPYLRARMRDIATNLISSAPNAGARAVG
jgi:arylsulfatase A-like enzyme